MGGDIKKLEALFGELEPVKEEARNSAYVRHRIDLRIAVREPCKHVARVAENDLE